MKLCIVDPGFESISGHHYELNRAIAAECARRGVDVRIGAHQRLDALDLPAERVFSHSIYDEVTGGWRTAVQQQTIIELAALESWELGADDLLLLHSVARAHFIALSEWIASLPAERRPRCVVLHTVGWFGGEWSVGHYEWSDEFRAAAERLQRATHVTFGAVNEELCRDWEAHSGCAAKTHPIPSPVTPAFVERNGGGPRFAFLGGARHEKGFDLLPDVAAMLIDATPDAEVVVQIAPADATSAVTIERLERLAVRAPRVRLHHGAATPEAYRALAGVADVMLQPYDGFRYRFRGSGLFFEAMSAGVPLVLPSETWMADEWKRCDSGGALFHDWTAGDVARAAVEVAHTFDEQRERARRAAKRWNASHSTAAFVDFVLRS